MRIPSGVTDQYLFFVAISDEDMASRIDGLSSFTVYRARDGGAAAAFTTPTVGEVDGANMPGVYRLLLDEDMTIGSGNDSEEMCVHITATGMLPVTRTFELYRPKITAGVTLGVESDGDLTKVNTLDGHTPQTGDSFARLGAPAVSVSADIAAVKAQTAAIETDTQDIQNRLPATLSSGRMRSDAEAISASTTAADNVEANIGNLDAAVSTRASQSSVDDLPTNSELATALAGADDAVLAAVATVDGKVDDILEDTATTLPAALSGIDGKIDTIDGVVDDILEDTAEIGAGGAGLDSIPWNADWDAEVESEVADALAAYDPPTKTELDAAVAPLATSSALATVAGYIDTEVAAILADTNELQTDWANGGRLDLLIDAIKAKTDNLPTDPADASDIAGLIAGVDAKVDDLPTNSELATALAGADDAVLAAIAGLNNLSAAEVNAEVDAALADYDGPTKAELDAAVAPLALEATLVDVPTNSELAIALAAADDAVLAAVAALHNLSIADIRTAVGLGSANLDTQLATIAGYIDTEVAAILAAVDTEVAAIKAKTDLIPPSPAAVSDIPTANANADALLDRAAGVETGLTIRQAMRLFAAVLLGKASGLGTTTATFRDTGDSKDRVVATVDEDGNRSAVTLDAA